MGITSYNKDGKQMWKVYVNIRSKVSPSIRAQKRLFEINSEKEALAAEKKLLRELSLEVAKKEGKGLTWDEVIGRWEMAMRSDRAYYNYQPTTIMDHVSNLRRWTANWLNQIASELTRADGRDMLKEMELVGKSRNFRKNSKYF